MRADNTRCRLTRIGADFSLDQKECGLGKPSKLSWDYSAPVREFDIAKHLRDIDIDYVQFRTAETNRRNKTHG